MLAEVPGKWHKPEPSLLPETRRKLQPPSPRAALLHLNRQPLDMQFFKGQFLPVTKHVHSQRPTGQRDHSNI